VKIIDPRQLAFDVLLRVDQGGYSDLLLDAALSSAPGLDPRDRGLATELVYGVLRRRGRLDFALARCCSQPLAKLETRVLWLLRLGAYQLLHLERVPNRAAVNETVELARRLGLERVTGLVNGVLRALDRGVAAIPWPALADHPLGHLQHTLSLPAWLAQRWLSECGAEEAAALAAALQEPAPFTMRANTLRTSRETLLAALAEAGHEAQPTGYAPDGIVVTRRGPAPLPGGSDGWFQVQDEASQLIPLLLAPQAGERILDGCAAPGGKTTELAALTGNGARIIALDLHPQRIDLIRAGAERLGCSGIESRAWDLRRTPDFIPVESLDKVLLDAPCSGLGVLRRNPETRWRRTAAEVQELAQLQRELLTSVAPLVRPGGVLLYSLCTTTPEETVGVVDTFLAAHPDFAREDARDFLPPHCAELVDTTGALRTLPHRHGGMDAFFAVRLRRAG
jgi:16S rRNA (cytosine967-C5)-methyltransferase